ncbi:hypothetical protein BB560_004188 [Smittium megazygosporum]|uniref:Ribose-5-phosphate isomerase n=1 Tax=Smittium megazygosporum TaxID=133381 RepID=A0A2T9ZA06_9FUNG|nr:hypothetical protein BB560_004188 [Smittium megazygosporum]
MSLVETAKRIAARAAVDKHLTKKIRVLGVGSGSTIVYAFERVVELARQGLLHPNLVCVPTSFQANNLIRHAGLTCGQLNEFPKVDLCIDGADEIDPQLNCIKGGGAAHYGEKCVAVSASTFILVADYRKRSDVLGVKWTSGVPVEVIPDALEIVSLRIKNLSKDGGNNSLMKMLGVSGIGELYERDEPVVSLRMAVRKAGPVVTDNGNFVLDVDFGKIYNPRVLEVLLKQMTGVLEVGLFSNMAQEAWFGNEDGSVGIRTLKGDSTL